MADFIAIIPTPAALKTLCLCVDNLFDGSYVSLLMEWLILEIGNVIVPQNTELIIIN
jgi:hypothetical protein